jgi:hypothetical protein
LSFPQPERRKYERFPITAQAEYILARNRSQATMQNIGRGGVLLKPDLILQVGESIEVLIDWPVPLDQRCPPRLLMFGKVLRSNEAGTAVGIARYEWIRGQNAGRLSA